MKKQKPYPITFANAFRKKYYTKADYVLKHLTAFNNGQEPQWKDLRKLFLIEFVKYLSEQVSPNSARSYCAYMKSLLNDYSEEIQLPCKDFADILSVKSVGVSHIYLADNEILLLLEYTPKNTTEHAVRNHFAMSCLTGMRHSDVIRLDLSNVNNSQITYLSEKTNTLIRTPNSKIVTNLLNEGVKKNVSKNTYNKTIREICEKVGINDEVKVAHAGEEKIGAKYLFVSSHTARRSFATNLYMATKDIYLVSKLMGHSNIEMTQKYVCCDNTGNDAVKSYFTQYDNILT